MATKALAKNNTSPALSLVGRLDPDLAEAVKSRVTFKLGGNLAESDGKGGDVVLFGDAVEFEDWRLPALIDTDVKKRAALAFKKLKAELSPPSVGGLRDWISQLGTLCAMRADVAQNSQIITAVYAKQLLARNLPAACFTDPILSDATVQFQWFPSFHELAEFLETIAAPLRQTLERLREIAHADEQDLRGTFPYHTPEERQTYWQQHRDHRIAAANERYGIQPGEFDGLNRDEALKAAYIKAGMAWPGPEKASWVKVAAAGMRGKID